jgi:hypothetical protein
MNESFLIFPFFCFMLLFLNPQTALSSWIPKNSHAGHLEGYNRQSSLPAGFHHAGDFSLKRQLPEADPA